MFSRASYANDKGAEREGFESVPARASQDRREIRLRSKRCRFCCCCSSCSFLYIRQGCDNASKTFWDGIARPLWLCQTLPQSVHRQLCTHSIAGLQKPQRRLSMWGVVKLYDSTEMILHLPVPTWFDKDEELSQQEIERLHVCSRRERARRGS